MNFFSIICFLCIMWLLQRLLLMELLSVGPEVSSQNTLVWSEELYPGEFDDLRLCNLCSEETSEPLHPTLMGHESNTSLLSCNHPPNTEVLQVLNSLLSILNASTVHIH